MADTTITAIAAQKGGTGKTALAGSLGPLLAYAGLRTLLVDLDQQANLSYAFAVNPAELDRTVVDVLAPLNAVPAESAILPNVHGVPGLDLLPCDERAEALDTQLRSETMGVYKLSDALESIRGQYDRILMDCPPNIGELTVSALLAADEIICPVNMGDINAVRGLSRLTRTVEKLNKRDAKVGFKSLVKVNTDDRESRQRLNSDALKKLAQRLGLSVARTGLRSRAAWGTAVTQDVPLILLEESDRGTREAQTDIHHLAHELWPEVEFLYPSEIKVERRRLAEPRKAAA
ncbi:MAG: AAA family ATPase [Solirubrobacterales bacterium]|nr:AAA family ATPase [Solirubrobacterales bacterium]